MYDCDALTCLSNKDGLCTSAPIQATYDKFDTELIIRCDNFVSRGSLKLSLDRVKVVDSQGVTD